jgi:1,4-alpha-glucan branching enzyme
MPGDDWQRAANLRLLLGHMWTHPGKKLLFMGGEFGQLLEWNHDAALQWHLLAQPLHAGLQRWLSDLNALYRSHPALHQIDFDPAGFQWLDTHNAELSVIAFLRKARDGTPLLVVSNFTPMPRDNYVVGVPRRGRWRERLNSDAALYGGGGIGNLGGVTTVPVNAHGQHQALNLRLPPLGLLVLEPDEAGA